MSENGQPSQSAEFDGYANSYDKEVDASIAFTGLSVDYFTRVKADYLIDLLHRHFGLGKQLTVLDLGCGVGNFHKLVLPAVGALSGADVSAECLAQAARRNPGVSYKVYDGERLPWHDTSFDAVFTACVMHHVSPASWGTFVAEMKRVVRPGGLAVVFEHNPLNPLTRRVVNNCVFDANAVLLRQGKVRALLAGAGFAGVTSRTILSIPSWGPLTRRIDFALGHLQLGAQYFATGVA
jgi:ubiquinone/menaquinone biosynthesis C-methylase UbiE